MAAQEMIVPDLTSDNFDLLRFPSLPGFSSIVAENDDLNMMARMSSLLDGSAKPAATACSPHSVIADQQTQQQQQMQQHMRYRPAMQQQIHTHQPVPFSCNSPGYPMLSSAPTAAQSFIPPVSFSMMACSLPLLKVIAPACSQS